MNQSEIMRKRWADPVFREKMRRGRWGTEPRRSHDEVKRYMRDAALLRKFGITRDEYNKILEQQEGVCKICQSQCRSGRSLAVDHDHKTGRIRGLLCADCNRALGMFGDDPEIVRRAWEYIL